MKKTTKIFIISIAAVVVLVGIFLLVYFVVPSESDVEDTEYTEEYNLISHVPADISKIEVKNETGEYTLISETPTVESTASDGTVSTLTEATVYTLLGYEEMELLTGSPDTLANDAASLTSTKIVNDGSNKSDFGFDSPRATVKVSFKSGEVRTIYLGNDADGDVGAYVMVDGDPQIYLVQSDAVDGYLSGAMDMLSTEIGFAAENDDDNVFTKMIFGGSHFGEDVVIENSDSTAYSESYVITSPDKTIANEETVTYMVNNVRNLTAEKVIAVNAADEKIKEYGLDNPYVTVEAEYPDISVSYKATEPDKDGKFYLMSNGIIYQMDSTTVPWINQTYDSMIPTSVMSPKLLSVEKVTVETTSDKYEFVLSRETTSTYDTDSDTDIETTTTKVTCNGKEIGEDNFNIFYQNLTSAQRTDLIEVDTNAKVLLKVSYEFTDGTTGEAVYYEGENRKCPVLVNGTLGTTAFESYVTTITSDVAKVAANETVNSVY